MAYQQCQIHVLDDMGRTMVIPDCPLIPQAGVKLLSVPKLDRCGYNVIFGGGKTRITYKGKRVIEQPMRAGNYRIEGSY